VAWRRGRTKGITFLFAKTRKMPNKKRLYISLAGLALTGPLFSRGHSSCFFDDRFSYLFLRLLYFASSHLPRAFGNEQPSRFNVVVLFLLYQTFWHHRRWDPPRSRGGRSRAFSGPTFSGNVLMSIVTCVRFSCAISHSLICIGFRPNFVDIPLPPQCSYFLPLF
jgi:hypothetical protein